MSVASVPRRPWEYLSVQIPEYHAALTGADHFTARQPVLEPACRPVYLREKSFGRSLKKHMIRHIL
jgi:hypothetical protein